MLRPKKWIFNRKKRLRKARFKGCSAEYCFYFDLVLEEVSESQKKAMEIEITVPKELMLESYCKLCDAQLSGMTDTYFEFV